MSDISATPMTSNRPYLIRAMHEWICDNGMTPYLLVDAGFPGVRVPPSSIRDGQVVLNVAPRAVSHLEMGNDAIHFLARFGGVSQSIEFPSGAVQAIYAQETGQGMMMPPESIDAQAQGDSPEAPAEPETTQESPKRGNHLRVVK